MGRGARAKALADDAVSAHLTSRAGLWVHYESWTTALAAQLSWQQDDRRVQLDELHDRTPAYDGAAVCQTYRLAKYPPAQPPRPVASK